MEELKKEAYKFLNKKHYVLAPEKDAWIEYPKFDPCRAKEVFAIVHWPATNLNNLKDITLTYIFN